MPKHVVFGAGLIGGYIGGVLNSLGLTTQLVCRPKVKAKLAEGLKITDYQQNEVYAKRLDFIDKQQLLAAEAGTLACDFLWITVKCTGVEQVAKEIDAFIKPQTILLCCQNGLGSDEIFRKRFPNNTILRVMVPFNVAEPQSGHLHRGSEGTLVIEEPREALAIFTEMVQQINQPILPVRTTSNMEAVLWAKLQLNLGNSVNALANIPVKSMLEQRSYRLVNALLMRELLAVTKALNINLPKLTAVNATAIPFILSLPTFIYTKITGKVLAIDPTVRSSMWWDLHLNRPTEILYLNGAVVAYAEKLNIPCPANKNIIRLIQTAEQIPASERKGILGKDLLSQVKVAC